MCSIVIRRIWPILPIVRLRKRRNDFYTETKLCLEEHQVRWGTSWKFLVAVCRPVLQILTLFQTKHCNFPHPFSDLASKIHTRFHVIITNIRRPTKRPLKIHFEIIGILLFLFYSFGIETTNKFIHPVVSSKTQENHSRF